MATLETSLEANYDRWTDRQTKRLIGARATALPKNNGLDKEYRMYMYKLYKTCTNIHPFMFWSHSQQNFHIQTSHGLNQWSRLTHSVYGDSWS